MLIDKKFILRTEKKIVSLCAIASLRYPRFEDGYILKIADTYNEF